MNFPNLSEAINRERDRIKNEFISSAFFRPYDGTVYCFFADEFSKYPPNGEILSDEEVEFNYRSFKENPSLWKKMQPNCIVQFLHDNHYTFLQRKNMEEVIKVMSAHTSPDGKLTPDDFPAAKNSITGVSVRYAPDPDKHWYVFRVSYGREDKASDFMVDDGTYTYIAKKIVEKYVGGKRKRYLQILIPNLLFAYTTKEKAEEYARNTPALSYLSYYYNHFALDANQKNPPLTVSDKEMNQFIHATSNMDKHLLFVQPSQCHFKGGELVRVIDGRFAGVEGRVARVGGLHRVVISLSNIGLISTAYIPTAFIKPIDTI
jgi:transcription antitermination factor NusG